MSVTLTNNKNLPDTIVKACLYDTHKVAGDLSCSQLIENPRVIMLKRGNNYTEDVSERLYMLMGTALHHIIERANMGSVERRSFIITADKLAKESEKLKSEEKKTGMKKVATYLEKVTNYFFPDNDDRFMQEVTQRLEIKGKVLYGTPDLFDKRSGILYDYKFCSVYQYIYPESRNKWEAQTNVYAYMLEQAGYEVKEIRVVAFFRDWTDPKFQKKKDYPPNQIMEISIKKRSPTNMLQYIESRIDMHLQAEETNILPFCSGKERWATADQFALDTPGAKKAMRVFNSKEEADDFLAKNQHLYDGLKITPRPGSSRKCDSFCPVNKFCSQYAMELEDRRKLSDVQ